MDGCRTGAAFELTARMKSRTQKRNEMQLAEPLLLLKMRLRPWVATAAYGQEFDASRRI